MTPNKTVITLLLHPLIQNKQNNLSPSSLCIKKLQNYPKPNNENNVENGNMDTSSPPPPYKLEVNSKEAMKAGEYEEERTSMEIVYKGVKIPSWKNQITVRAIGVSFVLGSLFTALVMKQTLTAGMLNPVNMYVGLVGFSCVKIWMLVIDRCGVLGQPFTRQENAVIQTCVLSITGITLSGGFGTYLFGMSKVAADQTSMQTGYNEESIKEPGVVWMILFSLLTTFSGLFFMLPLRKMMIVDLKLVYPTGTVCAHIINCINSPLSTKFARKQVITLGKFFTFSFGWSLFQWLFTSQAACGFHNIPLFGFEALKKGFYFDFLGTYVGVGMLCPNNTSYSMLVGGLLSRGFIWPYIKSKRGDWYPANTQNILNNLSSYRFLLGLGMVLGDSFYNVLRYIVIALYQYKLSHKNTTTEQSTTALPVADPHHSFQDDNVFSSLIDEQVQTRSFLLEKMSTKIAWGCSIALVALSSAILPLIFHPLKWYHVVSMYVISPFFAFSEAYVNGITDMRPAASMAKFAMILFGGWAGATQGGVIVALAACGVIMNFASMATNLIIDLKIGFLTVSSSKSLFLSQLIGTALGCIIAPLTFKFYQSIYDDHFGKIDFTFSIFFGPYYRNIAISSLDGFKGIAKHCIQFSIAFFGAAIMINIIKDMVPKKLSRFVPSPTAMAVPFAMGASISIDMCVGSLILFLWKLKNKAEADAFAPIVASGLICGDGIWTLHKSVLALLGRLAPACVMFFPDSVANALMETPGPWLVDPS